MRVVVTGGAGFIGCNLVRQLRAEPEIDQVVVIDDFSSGHRENLEGLRNVEVHNQSILDVDALRHIVSAADAIVHLAARPSVPRSIADPVACHEVNATGSLLVLEAARSAGPCHVIFASSSSVYGDNLTVPKGEDLVPKPLSPYAASKLAGEAYVRAYSRSYEMSVLVFRFFNVFGPWQRAGHAYAAVLPAWLEAITQGRPLTVFGDGRQSRDFTYVGSVTEVIMQALLQRVTTTDPVNLAFGSRCTLLDVIDLLQVLLDRELEVVYRDPRPGDVPHSQAASNRLRSIFPDVTPIDFRQGLEETMQWWRCR